VLVDVQILSMKPLFSFIILIVVVFYGSINAQETTTTAPKYSNEFLQIGVGADALGQSNAVVASTEGSSATYWNPAGLALTKKWLEVGGMHSEYFAGIAKYDFISLAHAIDNKSGIGFSMIRFAVDDIPNTTQLIDNGGNVNYDRITLFSAADYAFTLAYARKLKIEGLRFGGSVKLIRRVVGNFANAWGFGLDAGLQYDTKKNWRFGLMTRDITSTFNAWVFTLDEETKKVFSTTGNVIPTNGMEFTLPRFILGTQGKFPINLKGDYVAGELDIDITTDGKRNVLFSASPFSLDPHLGVEVGIRKFFMFRCGVGNMQYVTDLDSKKRLSFQPNIGVGIQFAQVVLNYAFTDIGDQSTALYSNVFSVKLLLDKPANVGQ
jgi:hypothetical protein